MKLPGQKTWSPGTCLGKVGPRSYEVQVGESIYRRNRRQLIRSNEPPVVDYIEAEPATSRSETTPQDHQVDQPAQAPNIQSHPAPLRRSERSRKWPAYLKDFVTQ